MTVTFVLEAFTPVLKRPRSVGAMRPADAVPAARQKEKKRTVFMGRDGQKTDTVINVE